MSAFMPHFAPIVVLLFLGTVFLLGVSLLVLFYGALRRSTFIAKLGAGAVASIILKPLANARMANYETSL